MKRNMILLAFLFAPLISLAQDNYAYFAWDYNVPLTNREWLDSSTPHGGALGYRFFIKDQKISLGVDLNWTTFDQYEPTETFQQTNGALTTDYYKYIYQYGGTIGGQYYIPTGSEIIFLYGGLGLGATYNQFSLYYNIYEDSEDAWAFTARPEAGVLIRFGEHRSMGAILAFHYDYSTLKSENYNYSGFSSAGFKIGLMVMNRY